MKINTFKYIDNALKLKINPICFSDLTLLVGVSGVGKTLILDAIIDLKKIVRGKSLNGVEWEVDFSLNGDNYIWSGSFENLGTKNSLIDLLKEDNKKDVNNKSISKIISEQLLLNGKTIVERNESEIIFRGEKTPKLSSDKSALNLLSEEEIILSTYESINRIIKSDFEISAEISFWGNYADEVEKYKSLDEIRNSSLPTLLKLACVYKNLKSTFKIIKNSFIDVFPQVEDIKVEPIDSGELPYFFRESPIIQIKEKNVSEWISIDKISRGMLKTFIQISELYLCAEDTVVLIDEFENSLGINCIDAVTDTLLHDNRKLQFIITSHHPYIINNVGMEYWKIVSRRGGVISTKDAKEFNLGKSNHEAFMQLIQLSDFKEGITF